MYDRELNTVGLNVGQWSLLSRLHIKGDLAIGALADSLAMDRTTLTRNLKPLQRDGLLVIGKGQDRRTSIVRMTTKGEAQWNAALPLWKKAQANLRKVLGNDMRAELHRSLDHAIATMEGHEVG